MSDKPNQFIMSDEPNRLTSCLKLLTYVIIGIAAGFLLSYPISYLCCQSETMRAICSCVTREFSAFTHYALKYPAGIISGLGIDRNGHGPGQGVLAALITCCALGFLVGWMAWLYFLLKDDKKLKESPAPVIAPVPPSTCLSMNTPANSASEQIAALQAQIEASRRQIEEDQRQIESLRPRALQELQDKLAASRALTLELQSQIAATLGAKEKKAPPVSSKKRKAPKPVTIAQIVEAIRGGAHNYPLVAEKLGVSAQTVTKKIKAEGADAGITSEGQRHTFRLSVQGNA